MKYLQIKDRQRLPVSLVDKSGEEGSCGMVLWTA